MEKLRVAYWNKDGEASEAIVEAGSADEAIASLDDYGHGASVTAVGPAAEQMPDDGDVNEGGDEDRTLDEMRRDEDLPAPSPEPEPEPEA
jgi:hypothetical protein